MIYELRLYTIPAGCINVTYERFEKYLPELFAKHSIRNVGRWTLTAGGTGATFAYMMAYEDLAERERQWAGFYRDPEWARVRAQTQGDEEAVRRFDLFFLKPNKSWTPETQHTNETVAGVQDLIFADIALGKSAHANHFLAGTFLPLVTKIGARTMLVADFMCGVGLPKIAMMIAWTSLAARSAGWQIIRTDHDLKKAFESQRRDFGSVLVDITGVLLLEPTSFALPLATLGNPI